ncbi:lysophospholipid acyltransferase family protein [bacterium]|nr:lysophospholipid acyltransferase family protein [bacterium]
MASRPRQWLDFALLYLLFILVRPFPWTWLQAWGRGIGSLVWRVFRYRRGVVLANLEQAFPDLDRPGRERLAEEFFRNLGMTLMEFLAFPRLKREDFVRLVDIHGLEHVDALVEAGGGALFVTGHFGNWELMAARSAAAGYRVTAAAKTQSNSRVDRIQNDIRRKAGVGVLRTDSGVRGMLRALRDGQMVALVADQDAGGDGYFTRFLNREASVFRGPAFFSWRTGVPVVTVFIFRLPDGRHRVEVEEPVYPDPAWDEATAVAKLTEHHVRRLEAAVRRAPELYFWTHRRWKTRPPAEAAGPPAG